MSHIFAVGYIDHGGHAIVTTQQQAEECSGAYVTGEMDSDDGFACRPLHHFSRLDMVESYIIGWQDAQRPAKLPPLQRLIDAAAELQELQDGMADDEFNRHNSAGF